MKKLARNQPNQNGFTPLDNQHQTGFTIVELSISTAIFGLILMLCVTGLLQISRMFYRGITASRTQEIARSVMDEISRPIQFSGVSPLHSNETDAIAFGPNMPADKSRSLCVGDKRYTYAVDAQINDNVPSGTFDNANRRMRHALWRDTIISGSTCLPLDLKQTIFTNPGEELLGNFMRLAKLDVNPVPGTTNAWKIDVWVVYGDSDLLDNSHQTCQAHLGGGGQFCASAQLSTVVIRRIR